MKWLCLSTLVLVALDCTLATRSAVRSEGDQAAAIARSGAPQQLADLMTRLAHSDSNSAVVGSLAALTKDPDVGVRRRAAMLLGAAGPSAKPAIPAIRSLLGDTDSVVRREAAFALGDIGATDSLSADALLQAVLNPFDGQLSWQARGAFRRSTWVRPIIPGPAITQFVRTRITDTTRATCGAHDCGSFMRAQTEAIALLDKLDAPWKRSLVWQALRSPAPDMRYAAAWTFVNMKSPQDSSAIASLLADSVKAIRDKVDSMLSRLKTGARNHGYFPWEPDGTCAHRQIDDDLGGHKAVVASTFALVGSGELRDDGRGPYPPGNGIESEHSYAYNFILPFGMNGERSVYGRQAPQHRGIVRHVVVDLSHPIDPTTSPIFAPVHDSTFEFHFFFMHDRSGYIWNTRDIPIGAEVHSDLTEFYTTIGGKSYNVHFGPFSLGDCRIEFGGGRGNGTTPVSVKRLSESDWKVSLPPGSRGRIWDYTERESPKDLGLYAISFDILLTSSNPKASLPKR